MSTSTRMQEESLVVSGEGTTTPENDSAHGNTMIAVRERGGGGGGGERTESDVPPRDDCCPICFGSFTVPCKSNCGHWYCGSCILQYWSYCAASRPCKCPMCSSRITKLTPQKLLVDDQLEQDALKVVEDVHRYNSMFVGGIRGLVQKVRLSPLIVKRMFIQLMDPDISAADFSLNELLVRMVAMFLSLLYTAASFDFIPTGGLGVPRLFDYAATALVVILRFVGIYRGWRLNQQVRHLAAANPLTE